MVRRNRPRTLPLLVLLLVSRAVSAQVNYWAIYVVDPVQLALVTGDKGFEVDDLYSVGADPVPDDAELAARGLAKISIPRPPLDTERWDKATHQFVPFSRAKPQLLEDIEALEARGAWTNADMVQAIRYILKMVTDQYFPSFRGVQ